MRSPPLQGKALRGYHDVNIALLASWWLYLMICLPMGYVPFDRLGDAGDGERPWIGLVVGVGGECGIAGRSISAGEPGSFRFEPELMSANRVVPFGWCLLFLFYRAIANISAVVHLLPADFLNQSISILLCFSDVYRVPWHRARARHW